MKDDPHAKQSVFPPLCSLFRQVIALFPVLLISNDSRDFHYPSNRSHLIFFFFFFTQSLFHLYRPPYIYAHKYLKIWRIEEIIIYRGKIRKHFYSDNKLYSQESSTTSIFLFFYFFLFSFFFEKKNISTPFYFQ